MISDDIFAQMVAEEVKNRLAPSRRDILMMSENWDRWKRCLYTLIENLDEQIDSLEADAEADGNRYSAMGRDGKRLAEAASAAYQQRLNKIRRFKFHVENRLHQVESMISGETTMDTAVEMYSKAISLHRQLLEEYDLEPTSIDRALWSTLEGRWDFDKIDASTL